MSQIILLVGILIFVAHFLSQLFRKTNIPDVLVLMLIGMVAGPVMGMVAPEDFGKVGSVIATIALVVILFESGTSLDLKVLGGSLGMTGKLGLICFGLTVFIVAVIGESFLHLSWLSAFILGAIVGGTSSAVVIPMVGALSLSDKPSTVLVLESALTDVLCIILVFALLQAGTQGGVAPGKVLGSVLAALIFALVIGVVGGLGWLLVLRKVRNFPNTISSTVAYVFIIYGITEAMGFSGAIAALALGVSLTNHDKLGLSHIKLLQGDRITPITETELLFYREAVFLLKTFFFVYLGISIHFGEARMMLIAAAMVAVVFAMRIVVTRFTVDNSYTPRDAAMTSMMAPKGLAAAVLAGLPSQYGFVAGEAIQDTTYMVVLFSIILCAVLVAAYPSKYVQRIYQYLLPGNAADIPDEGVDTVSPNDN